MNITQITLGLGGGGGIENVVRDLSLGLSKSNKVTIAASRIDLPGYEGDHGSSLTWKGMKIVKIKKYNLPMASIYSFSKNGQELLSKKKADIYHAHSAPSPGYLGCKLSERKKKPLVLTLHGGEINILSKKPGFKKVIGDVLERSNKVVCVSKDLAKTVRKRYDVDAKVIHNGVDVHRFLSTPSERDIDILYAGMLREEKGLDVLVDALDKMDARGRSVVIAGSGPQKKWLAIQLRRIKGGRNVKLLGYQPNHKLPYLMDRAKIFVLPSRTEGLSISLLEAMACGCIPVASRVGGTKEVLKGGCGTLVDPGDAYGFSKAIEGLLEDETKMKELSRRCRDRVEKTYSLDRMVRDYQELYECIVS